MPRYSLAQLIDRANAGNIGRRGLRRLQLGGVNPDELAQSGVQSPLNVNPEADLTARRSALYANAVTAAHNAAPGQTLSAAIQRRLQLGAGGPHSRDTLMPHSAQEVQAVGGQYDTILEALRKRSRGIASSAGVYRGF
jgi:hypothetical protein